MKKLLMVLLMFVGCAWGQDLKDQRACYVQAHKVASKNPTMTVTNHYDAHTKTCWVKEYRFYKVAGGPTPFDYTIVNGVTRKVPPDYRDRWFVEETIYNAFEDSVDAYFSAKEIPEEITLMCNVHSTYCKNIVEYEALTKKQYGF
jgi:hypothetical protein